MNFLQIEEEPLHLHKFEMLSNHDHKISEEDPGNQK
jgi:hypothetical protein